jgi:DNA-binding transcriptional LysR family regulator
MRKAGDTLKGLRLTEQHNASFATQDWADRVAEDPTARIDWIVYDAYPGVPKAVDPTYPNHQVILRADDMHAMQGLAMEGLGVVRMPMFLGRASGLVQLPVLPPQPYLPIWLVAHSDVWPAKRVSALRNVLVPFFRQSRARFLA